MDSKDGTQSESQIRSSEIVMPVCPICKKTMWVEKFKGYYDTFKHWQCDCHSDDLPKERDTSHGAYVCG